MFVTLWHSKEAGMYDLFAENRCLGETVERQRAEEFGFVTVN